MHIEKPTTHLRQYLEKHKISVPRVAKDLSISETQLYRIWSGDARPNISTAEKLSAYTNGELTVEQLRPPRERPKCPCCGRLLKEHHILKMRAEENRARKKKLQKQAEDSKINPRKNQEKRSRGLLFP